jgi:hypothetical protein
MGLDLVMERCLPLELAALNSNFVAALDATPVTWWLASSSPSGGDVAERPQRARDHRAVRVSA